MSLPSFAFGDCEFTVDKLQQSSYLEKCYPVPVGKPWRLPQFLDFVSSYLVTPKRNSTYSKVANNGEIFTTLKVSRGATKFCAWGKLVES